MKLADIIALSKAGYKRAEIAKMIEAEEKEKKTPPEEEEKETDQSEEETDNEETNEHEHEHETGTEPDYKAMYESTKKELEKLQHSEVRTKLPEGDKSSQEILDDLISNWN